MTLYATTRSALAAAALGAFLAGPALAQQAAPAMPGMVMAAPEPAAKAKGGSTPAFKAADAKMMRNMQVKYTGNADRDFVAGMIPHHQGAIDMAQIELQYGRDPTLHNLARAIVEAQRREIVEMKAWQAKHPGTQ